MTDDMPSASAGLSRRGVAIAATPSHDYDPNADALGSWEDAIAELRERHVKETELDGGAVTINNAALSGLVEEIERQFDERKIIDEALREIYRRAKRHGFDTAALRTMVKERRMQPEDRKARYRTLDEYRNALGLFADTPLGEAAMAQAGNILDQIVGKPKPFADQPVHSPRRRRPRKVLFDAEHPDGAA